MKCNLACQDVSTAAVAFFFLLISVSAMSVMTSGRHMVRFCGVDVVVVVVIVSPLSLFSKKAHSLLALFSGVFSSSGSLLCSSLGISLNMACELEESLVLAHKCCTEPCKTKGLGFVKCPSSKSDVSQASHKSSPGKSPLININILNLSATRQSASHSHNSSHSIQLRHWTLHTN